VGAGSGQGGHIPSEVEGVQFLTLAPHFGERSAILPSREDRQGIAVKLLGEEILWQDLDWLLIDTPPTAYAEMETLFSAIGEVGGSS